MDAWHVGVTIGLEQGQITNGDLDGSSPTKKSDQYLGTSFVRRLADTLDIAERSRGYSNRLPNCSQWSRFCLELASRDARPQLLRQARSDFKWLPSATDEALKALNPEPTGKPWPYWTAVKK